MASIIIPTSSSTLFFTSSHKSHKKHHHIQHINTAIKAQNNPSSSEEEEPTKSPQGFGPSSIPKAKAKTKERARIIRREPVETDPRFVSKKEKNEKMVKEEEQGSNERAFLLTWLGLGSLIIVEGLALAVSGFLPEEWDALFVKYLYPSFTPTVFLFVAGTVVYGVVKYLENEKPGSSS
uniref:protein LPA2 n=1 Tax=Erigeron canadensis TaxID=72917 RepID=UPI001CB9084D|nr:protein LPA2 [Erigeron canadensis]